MVGSSSSLDAQLMRDTSLFRFDAPCELRIGANQCGGLGVNGKAVGSRVADGFAVFRSTTAAGSGGGSGPL